MFTELWSDVRYRLRALFNRASMERDLDDEVRFHLERAAAAYERAGMTHDDAWRRARIEFGGVEQTKEESRDGRGTHLVETTLQDLRYAVRSLRARPGFVAGVVLTLALGIGATTVMFGVLDRVFFRPPTYLRDVSRVHRLYMRRTRDRETQTQASTSVGRFLDLRRSTHTLSEIAGFATMRLAVGDGQAALEYPIAGVSAAYLDLFDAPPALGRYFTAADDSMPMGTPVVVLGHAYWQTAFGGRRDVLGQHIRVGRMLFTIIGVAPKGFIGINDDAVPAMYMPLTALAWDLRPEDHTRDYHWGWLEIIVKRAPGVSVAAATADLTAALRRSQLSQNPGDASWPRQVQSANSQAILAPVQGARGPEAGPETKVLVWVSGVALIVLLIACANVANLLLARALTRRREIALRVALGVGRGRLIRQLVSESAVLAVLGAALGLVIAQWGGGLVRAVFLQGAVDVAVLTDTRTLIVVAVVALGVALITGLAPVTQALRYDLARSLNAAGRDTGAARSRLRTSLLLLQAMLSVVLLIGAGLFVRSLSNVRHLHLGYDVDSVLIVTEQKRGVKMTDQEQALLEQKLVNTARAVPGVIAATAAPTIPFWAFEGRSLFVAGVDSVDLLGTFLLQAGNEDYFRVMGTRIVQGRAFTRGDRADTPPVMIVSQAMARVLWPGQNALGKCVRIGADTAPCSTVVGIAEDLRIRSLKPSREFSYYVPISQYADAATSMLLVRVAGDAPLFAESVRRGLQRDMPGAAYVRTMPLRDAVDPRMASWRFGATMFTAFGAVALALAAIGLYGVISYGVTQRRQEIGVRLALGAQPRQVLALIVRGGVSLVVVGVVFGAIIAAVIGRWASSLLFNESPTDVFVYAGVAGVLVLVAIAASWLPAYAASRVDPSITLRAD